MAMLVWVLWPGDDWHLQAEPTIAFVLALGVWLWREYSAHKSDQTLQANDSPHPHDIALGKIVRSTFDSRTKEFLRSHDFGATFMRDFLIPIFDVTDQWRGVDYEFHDNELNGLLEKLIRRTRCLGQRVAIESGPVGTTGLQSVPNDEERGSDWFTEETLKTVSELNDLADEVLEDVECLERKMREKIPSIYEAQS